MIDRSIFSLSRDVFTVLALSIHAVFEGLAVGLESSSSNVWTMFAAIASHKFVLTFLRSSLSLSVSLSRSYIVTILHFSRFVITFCVSLELLQAGTSTVGFSLALITFSLVRSASQFLTSCVTQHGVNDLNIRF